MTEKEKETKQVRLQIGASMKIRKQKNEKARLKSRIETAPSGPAFRVPGSQNPHKGSGGSKSKERR